MNKWQSRPNHLHQRGGRGLAWGWGFLWTAPDPHAPPLLTLSRGSCRTCWWCRSQTWNVSQTKTNPSYWRLLTEVGWLAGGLDEWLVSWLVGCLLAWEVGWLVRCLKKYSFFLPSFPLTFLPHLHSFHCCWFVLFLSSFQPTSVFFFFLFPTLRFAYAQPLTLTVYNLLRILTIFHATSHIQFLIRKWILSELWQSFTLAVNTVHIFPCGIHTEELAKSKQQS